MNTDKIDKVEYKWKNSSDIHGDLICNLTKFMDKYLISHTTIFYTYIYNDLDVFSDNDILQVAFRVPGATRGGIRLKRLNKNQFEIVEFQFNRDVCFEEFACYKKELEQDIQSYIGTILDFSNVELLNNICKE